MSALVPEPASPVIDAYLRAPGRAPFDELAAADGPRPHQQPLAATIDALGLPGLLAARAETRHFVHDEGITHGSADAGTRRDWQIDPLPLVIDSADWAALERGLAQRAHLLDLVLADLYTDRTLLRRRVIPAAAVLSHPGFIRQADRIPVPGGRPLILTATDVGRDAEGRWQVISDRTQSPAGAGYAMATRRIVSRVMSGLHRSSDLARLRGFFHTMTAALMDAAPGAAETPRVVLLSPGSSSETAFDQAFLATMLGFPVVEADDLVTSEGRVWLRAGDKLEPVEVILRRVDAHLSDPLEFRGNSEVGVPGMIEAARNGAVTVVNPVGAGVLDNPALIAYLDSIASALLGEAPLLTSPQTWWCGDPLSASHVLANLSRLVVKPIFRSPAAPVRYGWELSAAERDELAARIQAEPWEWCGQEPLALSTAPVVVPGRLEPRRFVLRTFGVARGSGYAFLPGGLGRVAASVTDYTVSSAIGTLAKDVWVPSSAAVPVSVAVRPRAAVSLAARAAAVTPRVADTLTRIGRHAERAEATARLLKVADDVTEDHSSRPGTPGAFAMVELLGAVGQVTGIQRGDTEPPVVFLRRVVLDPSTRGSVAHSVVRLVSAAQDVRDLLSVDTWSVLSRLERTLGQIPADEDQLQPLLADVLESLLALAGIMAQSMVRDSSWAFLDAGARLERAQRTVSLLRHTLNRAGTGEVAELVAEAVLRAGESIITHRRRAAAGVGPATGRESALTLLLHDATNPRSVAHQLEQLASDLRLAGDQILAGQTDALAGRLTRGPGEAGVFAWLDDLARELAGLGDRIAARHFARQAPRHDVAAGWSTPWQVAG